LGEQNPSYFLILKINDMNVNSKCQIAQRQTNKNLSEGFTLVELLVVVIVVGILSAISLPAYLSLTANAKQSEARQNVKVLMNAQQLWIDEHATGSYPTSLDVLAVSVAKGSGLSDNISSSVYTYSISSSATANQMSAGATPKSSALKTYTAGVRSFINNAGKSTWYSVTCESKSPNEVLSDPTISGSGTDSILVCPNNYDVIKISGK
jgi:type IV pilus assembly protein PilA